MPSWLLGFVAAPEKFFRKSAPENLRQIFRELFLVNHRAASARPDIENVGKRSGRGVGLKLLMVGLVEEHFHSEGDIRIVGLELLPNRHIFLVSSLIGLLVVEDVERHFLLGADSRNDECDHGERENRLFHGNLLGSGFDPRMESYAFAAPIEGNGAKAPKNASLEEAMLGQ